MRQPPLTTNSRYMELHIFATGQKNDEPWQWSMIDINRQHILTKVTLGNLINTYRYAEHEYYCQIAKCLSEIYPGFLFHCSDVLMKIFVVLITYHNTVVRKEIQI